MLTAYPVSIVPSNCHCHVVEIPGSYHDPAVTGKTSGSKLPLGLTVGVELVVGMGAAGIQADKEAIIMKIGNSCRIFFSWIAVRA